MGFAILQRQRHLRDKGTKPALKNHGKKTFLFMSERNLPHSELENSFPHVSNLLASMPVDVDEKTFEPIVNTPALVSFLIISVVFSLLQFRINRVRNAAIQRDEALTELREIKSAELDSVDNKNKPNVDEVEAARDKYRKALLDELQLRTIIPGVRIVAPNDPERKEEDIAAARQFLDLDIANEYSLENSSDNIATASEENRRTQLLLRSRRRFDGKEENGSIIEKEDSGLSNSSVLVLFSIAFIQIVLLVILSFDPLTANEYFTLLDESGVSM